MKKLSIEKESVPNADILVFNLNQRMSFEIFNNITHISIEWEPLTSDQKSLILKILEIEGVKYVGIDQYDITVEKASVFTWEQIENDVITLILNNFPKDVSEQKELIKKYYDKQKESFQGQIDGNSKK